MSKREVKIVVNKKTLFWYVKLVGGNGETRLVSETFFNKGNALRAATQLSEDTGFKIVVEG